MDKLRIGVIGAGGIADRRSIPGMILSDRLAVVAVMDTDFGICKKVQEKYGVPRAYDTCEALLADPQVDAVYIASPVFCHFDQVVAAADAGKNILCEKPFGLSATQAQAMEDYCRKKDVLLAAGFVMRFHNLHQRMREIVRSGAIGEIVNMYANFSCWYPDNGSWRQKKESGGGGVLMDMAVHSIDLLQFVTGSRMKRVSAITRTRAFHYEVDDSASLLMELEDGGTCSVNSFFCIPDEAAVSRVEIYGTKGVLKADNTLNQKLVGTLSGVVKTENGNQIIEEKANEDQNMYQMQFEGFYDAILKKSSIVASGKEMVFIQKITDAAYESSGTGKIIEL